MSYVARDDIGHKVTWLVLGAVGVIAAAIVLTSVVAAHDDDSGDSGASEIDSMTLLEHVRETTYSPCGEILNVTGSGGLNITGSDDEPSDLRELGMFASVSGLPAIHSSRFQRCVANSLTGEVALSFLINGNLTLVVSNSDIERNFLVDYLGLTTEPTELRNDASPDLQVRSSIYRDDLASRSRSPVTGSSSFSLNDLLRAGR